MKRIFFFFAACIISSLLRVIAQPQLVDTAFIEIFPPYLSISPYISSSYASYAITSRPAAGDTTAQSMLDYRPNLKGGFGVDISYKNIDFSIGFRQKLSESEELLYGSTRYAGLGFRVSVSRKLSVEFSYKNMQGFTDRMSPAYDSLLPENMPYLRRNDITMRYLRLRAIYQFNPHKFSYRAAFSFSERQKRRKMGYFVNSHLYGLRISSDSTLFYPAVAEKFREFSSLNEMKVYSLGIAPGIGGTLTKGKWFITAIIFLGIDAQFFNYDSPTLNRNYREFKVSPMIDSRIAFGYNWKRFYAGFSSLADYYILNPTAFNVSSKFSRTYFSVGYRFKAPKALEMVYDKVMPPMIK